MEKAGELDELVLLLQQVVKGAWMKQVMKEAMVGWTDGETVAGWTDEGMECLGAVLQLFDQPRLQCAGQSLQWNGSGCCEQSVKSWQEQSGWYAWTSCV